jgi:hypothetical protein
VPAAKGAAPISVGNGSGGGARSGGGTPACQGQRPLAPAQQAEERGQSLQAPAGDAGPGAAHGRSQLPGGDAHTLPLVATASVATDAEGSAAAAAAACAASAQPSRGGTRRPPTEGGTAADGVEESSSEFFSPASTYAEEHLPPPPLHLVEQLPPTATTAATGALAIQTFSGGAAAAGSGGAAAAPAGPAVPAPPSERAASGGVPLAARAAALRGWLEGELGAERLVLAYQYLLEIEQQHHWGGGGRGPPGGAGPEAAKQLPELLGALLGNRQMHLALQVQRLLLWEEQLGVVGRGGEAGGAC